MRSLRQLSKLLSLVACLITLVAVLVLSIPISSGDLVQQSHSDRHEIRGVWITNVDSNVLYERDRLSRAIRELAQIHINTLYPVVWNWGYTTYPSPTAQSATGVAFDPRPDGMEGRDVLVELIQQGHAQGMEIIPWFEFGFMAPADSALAMRHPDWLTQRQDKNQIWQEGIWPRVWLNPFKPEVQQFILNLILEVVTRYDVDGIQLDDHFGLPYDFGYDAFTVQLYRQEHRGKAPPTNPKDPEWMRWRANKITSFVEQIFREVKARKRNVLITLSPNNYAHAYGHSLQDWRTWERQGLIEELVLQVYRDSMNAFTSELKAWEVQNARRHIPTGIGILTGVKHRTVPIQQIQKQVQTVRAQKFAGVSFFFYETMWNLVSEPRGDRTRGFKTLFPTPVPRPNRLKGWRPPSA